MSVLKTWGERIEEATQAIAVQKTDRSELRHTPMATRIRKLINGMPEAERMKPQPLQFFINALAPKYSGKRAAAREVATGLTELGFTKKRVWVSSSHAYCALWFPQEMQQNSCKNHGEWGD